MKLKKINEDIYYMENVVASDRPNLGYIRGEDYSVIVDAGNSKAHLDEFLGLIEDEGLAYPKYLILSHWHWDHSFGISGFKNEVIASQLTNEKLEYLRQLKWDEESVLGRLETGEEIPFAYQAMKLEYEDFSDIEVGRGNLIFKDFLGLDLGGKNLEIIRAAGPHEEDSSLVLVKEDRVLFAGDAHSGDYYNNAGRIDRLKMSKYLELLGSLDFDLYVPGHDKPVGKELIMEVLSRFI